MSGSSLNGLDIVCVDFQETAGKWTHEIVAAECTAYPEQWVKNLRTAVDLPARDYLLLHTAYGAYTAERINAFIDRYSLQHKIHLVASHGHTSFHIPEQGMTAQLGDGATIAALTGLPVVTDLRALDVAFGGQGAPIVPIGEKLLFPQYDLLLNLGGIANISGKKKETYIAFDVCPANRVLNMLANQAGQEYDRDGALAAGGSVSQSLLNELNGQEYYSRNWPKSLSNDFGTGTIFSLLENSGLSLGDRLATCTEHIAWQIREAIARIVQEGQPQLDNTTIRLSLLITGGGAFNRFLISRIQDHLQDLGVTVTIPEPILVEYKESLIMALIGLLRWREEYTVLATATGARRNSIGGALWMGPEA